MSVATVGATTAASPGPENATSNEIAGRPAGSASARAMRNVPGESDASSASATPVTTNAPAWKGVAAVRETTVPPAACAWTVAT